MTDSVVQQYPTGGIVTNQMLLAQTHMQLYVAFTQFIYNSKFGHLPVNENAMNNFIHSCWQNVELYGTFT